MNAEIQTIAALVVVGVVIAWFIRRAMLKRKNPGCGNEACSAVTPEVRRLKARVAPRHSRSD